MSTSGSFTPPGQAQCPAPMTVAALRALRDAAGLDPQCHYEVTDWVQGTTLAGPNTVQLHAVDASTLSLEVRVFTPYDNLGWDGLYDIDRGAVGQMTRLTDNQDNTVQDTDGTSTIVGTFPWGATTWRENYFDSVTLTAPATARSVTGNRITNSTIDMTGWTAGSFNQATIERGSVVTTGTTMSIGQSIVSNSTITGDTTGNINIQTSSSLYFATVVNDAGSAKTITVSDSDIRGSLIRGQGADVTSIVIGASRLRGKPAGDSITSLGASQITLASSDISFNSTWVIDGVAGGNVNITNATMDACRITRSNVAARCDIARGVFTGTLFDHQGSGQMFATDCQTRGGTARLATGSSGDLTLQNGTLDNGTMVVNSVRSLSMGVGSYVGGGATVTQSSTTPAALASQGDRIDQSRIEGSAQVTFSTTTGSNQNFVTRSVVRGSSVVGEGVVTVTGTTDGGWIDNCEVLGGIVTINNASSGLSGASAFTGNHVGPGCTVTYTGGDNVAKQVRNNRIEGLSTVTLTNLTGSAGAGLADVFGMSVRGQSLLTVDGARVAGFPIRDCTVEQGSTLNVPANGTLQRCRVAGGATLNNGAFAHQDSEISLATTFTATAANSNKLTNKAFSDWV